MAFPSSFYLFLHQNHICSEEKKTHIVIYSNLFLLFEEMEERKTTKKKKICEPVSVDEAQKWSGRVTIPKVHSVS